MSAFSAIATLLALLLVILGGVSSESRTLEEVLGECKKLEEKARVLKARKVPIHFEVKNLADGGKKHLRLYYLERGKPMELAELLPLDLSAFIEHGLARKQGDELDVDLENYQAGAWPTARIRPIGAGVDKERYHKLYIHEAGAGGIGYVRLSEDSEEKLYYVRVPFHLFPDLDGEALQEKAGLGPLHGYTFNTCSDIQFYDSATPHCLVMNFERGDLSLPFYKINIAGVFITAAKKVAEMAVRDQYHFITANPKLATDSHVQYVVLVDLQPPQRFHGMEPKFVEKHGHLVDVRWPTNKQDGKQVELVFEKKRVTFPLRLWSPRQWTRDNIPSPTTYWLRRDKGQPHGMGVTYLYTLHKRVTN